MQAPLNPYQSYINEYKAALEVLKQRKEAIEKKKKFEEEIREKLLNLKSLMKQITSAKIKQVELLQIEATIKTKSEKIEQTDGEIELQRRRCHNKQLNIMHLHKVINEFRKQFSDDLKLSEKKYQDLNILEIKYASRQRALTYQLGSYLFNEQIAGHLYYGIYQLIKDYQDGQRNRNGNKMGAKTLSILEVDLSPANRELEVSTGFGYLVILLNALSKYLNIPLKFPMYFCGSVSVIMGKLNENYPLYMARVYDRTKFNVGFKHLLQNLMQIFEYYGLDSAQRKAKIRKNMETLIKILQSNHA